MSNTTSPDEMTGQADPSDATEKTPQNQQNEKEDVKEKEQEKEVGKAHSTHTLHRKMLASHLHIPGSRQTSLSKPNSVRRLASGASSTPGECFNITTLRKLTSKTYHSHEIGRCLSARLLPLPWLQLAQERSARRMLLPDHPVHQPSVVIRDVHLLNHVYFPGSGFNPQQPIAAGVKSINA
jgi:hypothetical protein